MNKPFNVIKFTTMLNNRDENGDLMSDMDRIFIFGAFLRKFSIDEIPQLINIIKGEMSFIGPRPFIYDYLQYYTKDELKRHNVRPGITGWAQVNGRNSISWKEKFILDQEYVERMSPMFDLKIILLTIVHVTFKKNINSSNKSTMERYNGKN